MFIETLKCVSYVWRSCNHTCCFEVLKRHWSFKRLMYCKYIILQLSKKIAFVKPTMLTSDFDRLNIINKHLKILITYRMFSLYVFHVFFSFLFFFLLLYTNKKIVHFWNRCRFVLISWCIVMIKCKEYLT